jgi:hypothetical protein
MSHDRSTAGLSHEAVRAAVEIALRPGCFLVAPPEALRIERVTETVAWEVFRGHLLEPRLAGREESFASWHVFVDHANAGGVAPVPLISVRWQPEQTWIGVTRQILVHAHEAYEDSPGVILSRLAQKWSSELVGRVDLVDISESSLSTELGQLLFLAVVGTSRLPITSLETPLPAYSLGQLAYLPLMEQAADAPCRDAVPFLNMALRGADCVTTHAKALEAALRSPQGNAISELCDALLEAGRKGEHGSRWLSRLLRELFHGVALSPYTEFAGRLVTLILTLGQTHHFGPGAAIDLLGYMLRQLCRHLTAFDLQLFHNLGANYPDALFLDELLRAFIQIGEEHAPLVLEESEIAELRRRALREAYLVRRHYEGHRVPDAPTSTGENARVLPAPMVRVPDEQIREASRRRRTLFADDPTDRLLGNTSRQAFARSLAELDLPEELLELGMAHYLDRPLGLAKEPGEVDRTPLVSYAAFSRSIARERLRELCSWGCIDDARATSMLAALDPLRPDGVLASEIATRRRPGVVSLADATQAAPDFLILRTTRASFGAVCAGYDWRALSRVAPDIYECLVRADRPLVVPHWPPDEAGTARLHFYFGGRLRLELGFPVAASTMQLYRERRGVEWVRRLQVLRVWSVADNESLVERDLREPTLWIDLVADSRFASTT